MGRIASPQAALAAPCWSGPDHGPSAWNARPSTGVGCLDTHSQPGIETLLGLTLVRLIRDELVKCGAVKFGDFTLASGKKSPYYIDIKRASTDPTVLGLIGEAISAQAREYDAIAGMELGAVPIAVATSLASKKPFMTVRKVAKGHGTNARIEGEIRPGARVLLVEDVTTTGGSSLEAIQVLREAGLVVDRCVVVVDREEGGKALLADSGIVLEALVRASELLAAQESNA